jgi:hypothetical protein
MLTQLLDRCQDGIHLSGHIADADGAIRQACVMGPEGIVAERRDSRSRSGRSRRRAKGSIARQWPRADSQTAAGAFCLMAKRSAQ